MNEFRRTRFSPSAFIRGKALFLAGSTLFIVLLTLVLIVLEASTGGIIFIDLIARRVTVDGTQVGLTPKEFDVLALLAATMAIFGII